MRQLGVFKKYKKQLNHKSPTLKLLSLQLTERGCEDFFTHRLSTVLSKGKL